METLKFLNKIAALPLIFLLWIYRHTLSLDHGPLRFLFPYGYCKFYPTCSVYASSVLKAQGLIGLPKIIKRVLACTPNSLGGIDLP
ncbi:MAG: membrane protein insertion efficiency factor YidD [Candidatus Saccharibacteria bacterium]